jgi:hypothetical protein
MSNMRQNTTHQFLIRLTLIIFISACNTNNDTGDVNGGDLIQTLGYDKNKVISLVRNENQSEDMMNEFEFHKSGVLKRHERMIYDPKVMRMNEFPDNLDSSEWIKYSYLEETFFWENGNPRLYTFYFQNDKKYEAIYDSTDWKISSSKGNSFFAVTWTDKLAIGDTFRMRFLCVNPPALGKKLSIVNADSEKPLKGKFRWLSKNWGFLEFIVSNEGEYFEKLKLEIRNVNGAIDTIYSNKFMFTVEPANS